MMENHESAISHIYESDNRNMDEEINEKVAQLQHENLKLQDELNHLKGHTFSLEENCNLICGALTERENQVKGLKHHINFLGQIINDKEQLIDALKLTNEEFTEINSKLTAEHNSLREELILEKRRNEQLELLKVKEEELRHSFEKLKKENTKLAADLAKRTEEHSLSVSTVRDCLLHIKELEAEKAELAVLRDTFLREREEHRKTSENLEIFLRKSPDWSGSKSQTNLFAQGDHELVSTSTKEKKNLREEILEVEIQEKQMLIGQLESLIQKKEVEENNRKKLTKQLKGYLDKAGLLDTSSRLNFRIDSPYFFDIYRVLLKIIDWPEGQSGECKPLTEVTSLAVVVKDGVQTTQPGPIRIVETISIASQTDPIKNLSPVLPLKCLEKLSSIQNQSPSDSDDEQPLSLIGGNNGRPQLFSEHKNCDLDMDIYRSCRKLSVLPEEENDDSFNRKVSFKKPGSIKLKTQSADDVYNFKTKIQPQLKETASCMSIIPVSKSPDSLICDNRATNLANSALTESATNLAVVSRDLSLAIMSPRDVLRQPHSFDSYLDPQQTQNCFLARQISDPTQNSVFAPQIARRGSYIRKPRSTCRPLRFPCDKDDKKKEERVCKVRFDLTGIVAKSDENTAMPVSNANEKVRVVSRFRVEIIDEIEFRKSLEENAMVTRKRPPLIHSVVHKKSVLRDVTNIDGESEEITGEMIKAHSESPDSPTYDTATEGSPAGSIDVEDRHSTTEAYPYKRRKHSDSSCYSMESQDSSEGNDIIIKSIKLHTNSECIVMKEISRDSSDSSHSEFDIPYIDDEDLPVIKPGPDIFKTNQCSVIPVKDKPLSIVISGSPTESSDLFFTPCDNTPDGGEGLSAVKSTGLSKSPTVLKNLANFELLTTISESGKMSVRNEILEEEEEEEEEEEVIVVEDVKDLEENQVETLKRTSSDVSETSETDTLTYGTVKSNLQQSSDGDSDTYVTVWSDKSSILERKFSDLSENSSSPYNTPPDTSSASFCTPPDTYSPILSILKKYPGIVDKSSSRSSYKSSENSSLENKWEEFTENPGNNFPSPCNSPPPHYLCMTNPGIVDKALESISKTKFEEASENVSNASPNCSNSSTPSYPSEAEIGNPGEGNSKQPGSSSIDYEIIFESPKLEFYETNDSVETLEAFLQTEEGLIEQKPNNFKKEKPNLESLIDSRFFETEEELGEALSKRNSLESPKLLERRGKRHPPLSRQNSTEEYNFLDPHDSCLNLSEEISSPSTTPDTSNKTVIFKNIPLTVSNTIDLDDEDFPISEAEIQVNFNGSQTEILEMPSGEAAFRKSEDVQCCRSEPCTPSISSSIDFPEFSILRKQRSSFTEESLMCGKYELNHPAPPEIIVSNLSSDSDSSDSEAPAGTDFASNISDRSEVHLSDVNSISGQSDNCGSISDHSDNVTSDVFISDSDKSSSISPEVSQNSSSPQISDKTPVPELPATGGPRKDPPPPVVPSSSTSIEAPQHFIHERSDCFRMPKPSEMPNSGIENSGEGLKPATTSSEGSLESTDSKDVNLNSKNFADCNLRKNGEMTTTTKADTSDVETDLKSIDAEKAEIEEEGEKEEPILKISQSDKSESVNLTYSIPGENYSVPALWSSTPKPESAGSQMICSFTPINSEDFNKDQITTDLPYETAKSILSGNPSLTDEEIGKKFQDLSFAFKTDSLTIQNRLLLLKRKRDQAEQNIENELKTMKAKLESLQYLGVNSENLNLMTDLKKQMDFVLNATFQLSSSAEGYGYAQHEERLLEFATIMMKHVENVETLKNKTTKILDKLKVDSSNRPQSPVSQDCAESDDDRVLRRRSVAAMGLDGSSCRRRASIATLPRLGSSLLEGVLNGKGSQWITSGRPSGGVAKKLSFSQCSTYRGLNNSTLGGSDTRRNSFDGRVRSDSRGSESSMKNIEEEFPDTQSAPSSEPESLARVIDADSNTDVGEAITSFRSIYESIEEITHTSMSQGSVNVVYLLRRIVEWNKLLLSATRFRWPENGFHYVPFYITWYVVFVLAFVFFGGLFTGINGCYTYFLQYSSVWLAVLTLFVLFRRFYRFFLLLLFTAIFALTLLFLWLTLVFLPELNRKELDSLFRSFGLVMEVRYPGGPPPM